MSKQNNRFWYDTPRDMLAKLDREIQALVSIDPLDNQRRADTLLNAAITAWQLNDWVQATITKTQRSRVSEVYKKPLNKLFLHNPNLTICRQIATAGKHAKIKQRHHSTARTKAALCFDFKSSQPALEWMISVGDYGDHVPAKEVLDGARDFWSELLDVMDDPPTQNLA
jgi:hypothetical protein